MAEQPNIFLQFKNTDICYDFTCECGDGGHFDGYFGDHIKCKACGKCWLIPYNITPLAMGQEKIDEWDGYFKDSSKTDHWIVLGDDEDG